MTRPTMDQTLLRVAVMLADRGTCVRRKVGCVLADKRGRVLSTGYNGVPSEWTHCIDDPCPGAQCESGEGLDLCQAIHAEQNALLQCPDTMSIRTCYVTHSPCVHCVKLLMNTSCTRIVYGFPYSHDETSASMWRAHGGEFIMVGGAE